MIQKQFQCPINMLLRKRISGQENEPGSWGQATGLKKIHPPNKLKQSLSRWSHKNYLFSRRVVQTPLFYKLGIMMLPLRIYSCYWCERLHVDVKYHYVTTCGPQASSLITCSVKSSLFPSCCWKKNVKKQHAVVIIIVNPFGACRILSSNLFTYLTKHMTYIMILHCPCILRLSLTENYVGSQYF